MLSHHPSTVYQKLTWLTNAKDENLQAELYSSLVEESDQLETWTYLNSAYSGKFTNTYNAKWIDSSNTQKAKTFSSQSRKSNQEHIDVLCKRYIPP